MNPALLTRAALVAGLGVAAFLLAATARTVLQARAQLHPPRRMATAAERERARAVLPALEEISFVTEDGLALRGWFSPGPRRDGIALVHGLGGNRASLLDEAALLARRGHGVLLFDSRASGESEGALATWGPAERRDVSAALSFLAARPQVDPARLGLFGFSVGATAVALEAARDPRARAIALGPLWPSLAEELRDKFHRWGTLSTAAALWTFRLSGVDVGSADASAAVEQLAPRPLFFVSGSADADTPPAVMDRVCALAPGAARLLIAGAGHGGYAQQNAAALDRGLGGFFDQALGGP